MKKAILIVSFGTTYTETRIKNITAIKNQVSMLYPDTIIEEAVSSRIVRNHMKQDEHIDAKSPLEALMSLKEQGATGVVVFPTHVIDGIENNQMKNAVEQCRTFFEKIVTADALLSNVDDYTDVSKALWESLKETAGDSPLIFMGHGTEHSADESYMIMLMCGKVTNDNLIDSSHYFRNTDQYEKLMWGFSYISFCLSKHFWESDVFVSFLLTASL